MNLLFVIHSPKNANTAVYKGYLNKQILFKKNGWSVDILSPDDFSFSANAGRYLPLVYPFQVARWLYTTRVPFDLVVFHSYCGWVFHLLKKIINRRAKPFKTATTFHGVEELFFHEMVEEGKFSGKPVSLRFRIFYCFLLVRLIKLSCHNSDKVFCLNQQEKLFLEIAGYQTPGKVAVLPNDIHSGFFESRVYNTQAKTMLFVGQWLPMKGIHYLIQAFEVLSREYADLKLVLAGTLRDVHTVLNDFPKNLHSKIQVIPETSNEKMKDYYKQADIFISPSLYEAFNRSLVEAMATGLPAISTSVGIVPDNLKDGVDHIQVPFRDSEAIAKAVETLIHDSKRRESIGKAAQESAKVYERTRALDTCFKGYYDLMKEPLG